MKPQQAIQFETTIKDCKIELPPEYHFLAGKEVEVLIMYDFESGEDKLLQSEKIKSFAGIFKDSELEIDKTEWYEQ